jgi:HD superfamily phosphohydrolase
VAYGIIDIDRIVHTLSMEKGSLCIEKGGLEAAEYLLVARFMMFSTVYLHRTVRIATAMLYRALEGAIGDGTLEPGLFADMDDEQALSVASKSAGGGKYVEALARRRLYKEICTLPRESINQAAAGKLEKRMTSELGADIIIDYPHPFFKPVGVKVLTEEGMRPISELSKLIQPLKKAEEERMRVLVLGEEKTKERFSGRIAKMISQSRSSRPGL